MNFKEMKVTELREECKKRGLRISSHDHKYTKSELIQILEDYENFKEYEEYEENSERACEDLPDDSTVVYPVYEIKPDNGEVDNRSDKEKNYEDVTIEDIVKKYSHRKPQYVYDEILCCGCYVVFVQEIETRSGKKVRKLRRGQVTNISRTTEKVEVTLRYGDTVILKYNDLLYICECDANRGYPTDIYVYFIVQNKERKQRIEESRRERLQRSKGFC